MATDLDALLALARSMTGKNAVSQSDLNTLFSPEVGVLTGTMYQDPNQSAQDEENLFRQYAPNLRLVLNLPDTDIRKIIANEIINFNAAPWDVKRQIEEYTAGQAELNPGVFNQEGETSDLMKFADTVFKENNDLQIQRQKQGEDEWSKVTGGLPRPEMQFAPEQLAPELFQALARQRQSLATEKSKGTVGSKTQQSAMRFLEQQKTQAAQRKAENAPVPHPSLTKNESIKDALMRNLANTPMGKGEAGIRGLIPLYKSLEQIPAGAMALYKSLEDPLVQEGKDFVKYFMDQTFGGYPNVSPSKDVIGEILYGKPRSQTTTTGDKSDERAEDVRFARVAKDVVARASDPKLRSQRQEAAKKEKWVNDLTNILGMLAQQRAASVGYTPYQEALTARQNFLAGGR